MIPEHTLSAALAGVAIGANGLTTAVLAPSPDALAKTLVSSTGVTATQVDDFIITGAIVQNGLVATSITDAVEVPSALVPGGIFLSRTQTRLPDFSF